MFTLPLLYQSDTLPNYVVDYHTLRMSVRGPGSAAGIATAYGLDGRGSNPGGGRFSATVQTDPEVHPASSTMGTGSFPGVRCGRGVTLNPHPLLVPRSKIE
jgi:hypothetical protein